MLVKDVIDLCNIRELQNLKVGDEVASVLSYINESMVKLYDRFDLKVSEQILHLASHTTEYTLDSSCMRILGIYDANGDEFVLDDTTNYFSVFQIAYDTIQFGNPKDGTSMSVIYVASPVHLVNTSEVLNSHLKLPPQLIEALILDIAYKAHTAEDGTTAGEGNVFYQRYEAFCRRIEATGSIRKATVPSHVNMQEDISETRVQYEQQYINSI